MCRREKKGLTQQLEKLQEVIAQLEQKHVEDLAAKDIAHMEQLQKIRNELEQHQRGWVSIRVIIQHAGKLYSLL